MSDYGGDTAGIPSSIPTTVNISTTFASRNPGKAVQQARGRKKGEPLSDSQKKALKEAKAQRKVRGDELFADIEAFCAYRGKLTVDLATKHDRSVDYIKTLLLNESSFKSTREVTLRNAIMHHLGLQAEAPDSDDSDEDVDQETARKRKRAAPLLGLHARADAAIKNETYTEEEQEDLKQALRDHRELKHVGLRASNIAAAADVRAVAARLQDEIGGLNARTGTRGFIVLTRGHVDDASMPAFMHSGGAVGFLIEVLKMTPHDMLAQLEQWSCTRSEEKIERDTRQNLCARISALVLEKFHIIINDNTVRMDYVNMDVAIREMWKVEIQGWPSDIPMEAPSKIRHLETLRRLRDGWVTSAISWVAMTPAQVVELAETLAAIRASNGGVVKKRKARSDTNGTHKAAGKKGAAAKPRKTSGATTGAKKSAAKGAARKVAAKGTAKGGAAKGKGRGRVQEKEDEDEDEEEEEKSSEDEQDEESGENEHDEHDEEVTTHARILRASVRDTAAAAAGPSIPTSTNAGDEEDAYARASAAARSGEDEHDEEDTGRARIPHASVCDTAAAAAAPLISTSTNAGDEQDVHTRASAAAAALSIFTDATPASPSSAAAVGLPELTTTFIQYMPPAPLGDATNKRKRACGDDGGATIKRKAPGTAKAAPKAKVAPKAKAAPEAKAKAAAAPLHRPGSGYKASARAAVGGRSDDTTERAKRALAERSALALAAQLPPQ
ncbi:hypothetical protein GGX14DRAFT_406143 [Mycena pura]|uniref:Uncharacterized protein n=1 Tax=Mycena pura TaxID=153505 RepID=A0AAD6UTU3_9AGAR|nr:hypothetical protein GGX14DRAFT_406143 [Mycena pura]